jgi:hypothetical protein
MIDPEEPWIASTLKAVKYIRTCQGSLYRKFKVNFPDYPESETPSADYLAWVWDWLIMHTPYEEVPPGSDILVWQDDDDTDFLETEEKFTHRGHSDWN